jgi:hypothetical protein
MTASEQNTKIISSHGIYNLRDIIALEGATDIHPLIGYSFLMPGTHIAMTSLKSCVQGAISLEKTPSGSKFVELSSTEPNGTMMQLT